MASRTGPDGPIFVPGVLPGEEVSGTINGDRLEDVRIITPSADRVKPPCAHARTCGGCQLQHAADDFVAAWKRQVVCTALTAQGLSADGVRDAGHHLAAPVAQAGHAGRAQDQGRRADRLSCARVGRDHPGAGLHAVASRSDGAVAGGRGAGGLGRVAHARNWR